MTPTPEELGLSNFSPQNSEKELLYLIAYYLKTYTGSDVGEPNPQGYRVRDLLAMIATYVKG